jgi:APA family basic amino acid/polyamine antiporter
VFAAISALGTVNGLTLTAAELPRAMALVGQFPQRFAGLNRAGAPAAAVLLSGGLAAALVLLNTDRSLSGLFEFTILVATAAMLGSCLPVQVYRRRSGVEMTGRIAPISAAAAPSVRLPAGRIAGLDTRQP